MKKLVILSLAAIAMASCSKESVVDTAFTGEGNKIGFNTYSNITRGNPVDNNAEFMTNGNNFGVTAFISTAENPYMGAADAGAQITYGGTKWDYATPADIRYWPTGGETLSFYAYAPFTYANRVAPTYTKAEGMVFSGYTVPAKEASQLDFMYASALNVAKTTPAEAVSLVFHHALTQIHFKVKAKASNMYIDVAENGIQLHNINSVGNFALAANAVAKWTNPVTPIVYTVTSDAKTIAGTTESIITKTDNALMLMPQTLTAWNKAPGDTTGAYLTISCKLYYKNQDGVNLYLYGSDDTFAEIKVPFNSKNTDGAEIWNMRNKITYTLTISGEAAGLEPIEFTTDVENWADVNGSDIEL